MTNIFILYIPTGNYEALTHYQDTIKNKVSQDRIFKFVDTNLRSKLTNIFGHKPIATWGSRNSDANRSKFEKMQAGDDILIVEGATIKLLGKVAAKTINADLSKELWKNLKGESLTSWDLVYFIANPLEIDLSFAEFKKLFAYKENWSLRGFTSIAEEKLEEFYGQYDDLYSILLKIKKGEKIEKKKEEELPVIDKALAKESILEFVGEKLEDKELSDHVIMQYKLLRLGVKSGSKVWAPRNDQSKITKEYGFSDFETEFSAGIDTPAKYVENIDVVWKEEYRIDAAFEIENSTSIYSGLLRFADLKLIAPNSIYPFFIVAPTSKRNRVLEQIKRPSFKELDLQNNVRYLSYEVVDEVDKFFENSNQGLNINLLIGKSELIR